MSKPKPLYYVILSRPKGSKTWTPFRVKDQLAGNFFATVKMARRIIDYLIESGHVTRLFASQKLVRTEFSVGQVTEVKP